ncbi:MAG: hypothetical protein QXK98_05850, partial [Candidatus Bathyarchaeia archaeon]
MGFEMKKMSLFCVMALLLMITIPTVAAEPIKKATETSSAGFDAKLKKLAEREKMAKAPVQTKPWTKFDPPNLNNILNETERLEEKQALEYRSSNPTLTADPTVYGDWRYTTMWELRGDVQDLHVIVQGPDLAYVGTNYEVTVQITMS